jgi:DNA repair protein RadC
MRCDAGTGADGSAASDRFERHLHAITDAEVLGVLLAGGRVHGAALRLARELLTDSGGLAALPGASRTMLRHRGLRDHQASALLAALEIACRLARRRIPVRHPLTRPEEVARFLALRYQQRDQEVIGALFLDARHRLLGEQEIFRGTLHRAAVEPREILKQCLLRGAGAFVLFHTRPSGDPTPRAEDLRFTRQMAHAAALVGVTLVDHLVGGKQDLVAAGIRGRPRSLIGPAGGAGASGEPAVEGHARGLRV